MLALKQIDRGKVKIKPVPAFINFHFGSYHVILHFKCNIYFGFKTIQFSFFSTVKIIQKKMKSFLLLVQFVAAHFDFTGYKSAFGLDYIQ